MKFAYSYSRLNAFKCRRRFKKLYIDKLKEKVGVPAIAGGLVHDVMKIYLTWLYKEEMTQDLDYLTAAAKHVKETREYSKEVIVSAEATLSNLGTFRIDPRPRQFWIEQKLCFDEDWKLLKDWFDKKAFFRAIVDWTYIPRDQATLFIIDHKSGWSEPDPDQLPIYALTGFLALKETGLVDRIEINWNMIAQGGRQIEGGFFSPEDLPEIKHSIMSRIQEIEDNTIWEPTAGPQCGFCGFRDDCPALDKSFKEIAKPEKFSGFALDSPEKAEKALELVVLAGQRLKDLEKLLAYYVKEKGPIKAVGKVMEQRKSSTWTETENFKIQKKLREIGIHPIDVVNEFGFTETKLKTLLNKHGRFVFLNEILGQFGDTVEEENDPKIYVDKEVKK